MMNPSDQSALDRVPGKTGTLGPELQAHIGRQLRSLYDEMLKEPVPEHLRELLAELEKKSSGSS
jgi:Anti-sigma factor NepR